MTQTAAIMLLYLVALFLTFATRWPFSHPTRTVLPIMTHPQSVWVLILIGIPFAMLIYFGAAFLISGTISVRTGWLAAPEDELSFEESLVVAISYVGLSGWVWLRWRNPTGPSTKTLGRAIIATVIILIIVSVIWAAHHDQYF